MEFKHGDLVKFTKAIIASGSNQVGDHAIFMGYNSNYKCYMVKPITFKGLYEYFKDGHTYDGCYMIGSLKDIEHVKKEELLDENT